MNSIRSIFAISALAYAAALAGPAVASVDTTVITFDNFDASSGPVGGAPVIAYLAGYGVTWTSTAPITPYIQEYPSWLNPVSSPNYFSGGGSAVFFTYEMSFSKPLDSVSFTIPSNNSSLMAAWSATAYSASNAVISSASDPFLTGPYSAAQTITLDGPDIAYVVFSSNAFDFAGDNLEFDNLTLVSAPEPATWALMLAGFAGLGAALRSRRRLASA
jgi:hypothetical protein